LISKSYKKYKGLLCVVFVFFLFLFLNAGVFAENQAEVRVSRSEIFKKIEVGKNIEPIIFHISEESDEFATEIKLFTDGLEKEDGGKSIDPSLISMTREGGHDATDYFVLNKNDHIEITITVKTKNVAPGNYKGKIGVDATNATGTEILLQIQVSESIWIAGIVNLLGVGFGIVLAFFGIVVPQQKSGKKLSHIVKEQLSWTNIKNNYKQIVGIFAVLVLTWFVAFEGIFPKLGAFGASPIDYITVFVYGITQVGASKMLGDIIK
jgi:hypothetical protein